MTAPHSVVIGCSGWSYADWVGPFYSPGTRAAGYLASYAERFSVVEVDSTYYRPPTESMARGWAERTPTSFRFALKMPGEVTHKKILRECDADVEALLAAVQPLGDKLACVLLQFSYFNRAAFTSPSPFMERLEHFLGCFAARVPLAVEIRNKAWLTADYFAMLRAHRVTAALVEHAWLPPIEELAARHDVLTGPFSYVRLIGDREAIERKTTSWGEAVVDRSADLPRIALALRDTAERAPVYVFVNNHYAGHGPGTCRELREKYEALTAARDADA
jgi:uncharacterized protein YecE (DUF72 family)